jgi:hypothetical protein
MTDFLNIRVTEEELDFIMDLLQEAGERTDSSGQPAFELLHDLMEQAGRAVDEDWDNSAEAQFIDAGISAREQLKARQAEAFGEFEVRTGSLAALRRREMSARMMAGTAKPFVDED